MRVRVCVRELPAVCVCVILSVCDMKCVCEYVCLCPTPAGCLSIVGGRDARRGAWPWMVHLEMHHRGGVIEGGGSLISDQWVMTATFWMG